MKVNLITPEKTQVFDNIEAVILPAWEGSMEVLPGHIPYTAILKKGNIEIKETGKDSFNIFSIVSGLAQIDQQTVNVLTKSVQK